MGQSIAALCTPGDDKSMSTWRGGEELSNSVTVPMLPGEDDHDDTQGKGALVPSAVLNIATPMACSITFRIISIPCL